jgi:rfaE bifunctional protein kinase chain/domain
MNLPPLAPGRAHDLVTGFAGRRVLVAGDVMLDRFIVGDVSRISPEAPVPIVTFAHEYVRLGGAANVAHNVAALGGRASLVGVVGHDPAAARVREGLAAAGVEVTGLVDDPQRPTTEKVRIVTRRNQQVARVDYERDHDVDGPIEAAIVERARALALGAGALLVSDYLKGAVTRPLVEALVGARRAAGARGTECPLVIDPKIPHLAIYGGATIVTPNQQEAEAASHRRIRTEADAREAAREFSSRAGCEATLITRGEHGLWLSGADVEGAAPASAREVADVTGAGDTIVATLALALAAGASLAEAAVLANLAAGLVVARFGPATATAQELIGVI